MKYKLKAKPKQKDLEKYFKILDENGVEYPIKMGEYDSGTEYYIWKEGQGGWNDIADLEIINYLQEDFYNDEYLFDREEQYTEEKLMDSAYDSFIKEHGKVLDINKFFELVDIMMKSQIYNRDYYNRFYDATHYAKNKLGL